MASKSPKRRFVTSALPYVNNQPHLGNVVGSVLSGDVYSRFSRKAGYETVYISGTDEYGTATEMEAMRQGVHPRDIVQKNREIHKKIYSWFDIEFDLFGSTDCEEHRKMVQEIFWLCWNNGFFSKEEVEQYFCASCDQFLADRYVEGTCRFCKYAGARGDQCDSCGKCLHATDLEVAKCALCNASPVLKRTKQLVLLLNDLHSAVTKHFTFQDLSRWSQNALHIFEDWIGKELHPRSMTRSLKYRWGVPVPLDGFEDKVFYVWFDAPIGYFTFLKQHLRDGWEEWLKDADFVQFMGKDNVPFHSLIFPSILLAASTSEREYPVVNMINSTEYLMFNGEKFSKSRGVGVFGMDLLENDLGCSDFWRFFLMKIRPETKDADFVVKKFIEQISTELIANWGNFCNRTLKYIHKNLGGVVCVKREMLDKSDDRLENEVNRLFGDYKWQMEKAMLRDGLCTALKVSTVGNKYLQELQGNRERMGHGFSVAYSLVVFLAHLFEPFTPRSSQNAFKMCCVSEKMFPEKFEIVEGASVSEDIQILFKPWSKEQLERLGKYIPEHVDVL